tara:strand:+ start:34644 stop:34922 length:279 start_codon:yes stop_codon:yes gene_type:complete
MVVNGPFKKNSGLKKFNGDVFSSELKLYQLETVSLSASKAYMEMVTLLEEIGINSIRFIEIYLGALSDREACDKPVLIHHESTDEEPLFGQQ